MRKIKKNLYHAANSGHTLGLSVSLTRLKLFTGVDVVDSRTLLTADVAAPVEDAVTLLFASLRPGVVSSAAAQQLAPIDAVRRQVTRAILCPKRTRLRVRLTEVGRTLVIDEVCFHGRFKECVFGPQGFDPPPRLPVFLHHHF